MTTTRTRAAGSDLLSSGVCRSLSLARLPMDVAGRATFGLGKRIAGRPAEQIQAELAQQTMAQLFGVLGRLKGGATKFGQALSMFEATLPEPWATSCREALTGLQNATPAMPVTRMENVLADELGSEWRDLFLSFDDTPAATASIGQVHRAVWHDGRAVAVKVQYPGIEAAMNTDITILSRLARMVGVLLPGLDTKPLIAELAERVLDELDYTLEAEAQRRFAEAYRGDPDIAVPEVLMGTGKVLVSEWLDGVPLARIVSQGTATERDRAGFCLSLLQFSAPVRCGLLHADPHPGNFLLLDDGRLGVLDFGAVGRFPDGMPCAVGRFSRLILDSDVESVVPVMRAEGFLRAGKSAEAADILGFLRPVMEPLGADAFTFTRDWLREHATAVVNPRSNALRIVRALNLPPEYLALHRASLGTLALLCQLGATAPYRRLALQWQPGFRIGVDDLHVTAVSKSPVVIGDSCGSLR